MENNSASQKASASRASTEVAPSSIADDLTTSSTTVENVTTQAPDDSTKNGIANEVKVETVPTRKSVPTQKKQKSKVNLSKPSPSARPSVFGKIKFDKNFAKKPQPSSKIVKSNGLTDERLKAFGINPRRFNWKLKHGKSNDNNLKKNPNKKNHPNNVRKPASSNSQTAPPKKMRKLD